MVGGPAASKATKKSVADLFDLSLDGKLCCAVQPLLLRQLMLSDASFDVLVMADTAIIHMVATKDISAQDELLLSFSEGRPGYWSLPLTCTLAEFYLVGC